MKHYDLEIPIENPFENCKLNRKQYADILTQIVDNYKDGFVLAINNKWGTGKTTFVNMWQKQLIKDGFKTVYFNAWENDFEDNALTALMGELSTLTNDTTEADFKQVLQKGAVIAKNILPGIVKAVIGKYIDVDELKDFAEAATKGMTEIFEEDVKEYAKKKESISQFKDKLQKFIKDTTSDKPLVFIIDELDRCRPNYAVSVLEQIKHFFSVPGIVFVLSIDKEQLGCAVKGVYGNDKIDADEYLRRFIDVEYNIPEPNIDEYCDYLYNYYGFDDFFRSKERNEYRDINNDGNDFIRVIKILFIASQLSIRQQQKILSHARLALKAFDSNNYVIPTVFAFLIHLKFQKPDIYRKIKLKSISTEEIQSAFVEIISPITGDEDILSDILYIEADIIYFSENHLANNSRRNSIIFTNSNGEKESKIISKIDSSKSAGFINIFEKYNHKSLYFGFTHQIDKIELIENFKMTH